MSALDIWLFCSV